MVDLVSYIKKCRQDGFSDEKTRAALEKYGYKKEDIDNAFASVKEPVLVDFNPPAPPAEKTEQTGTASEQDIGKHTITLVIGAILCLIIAGFGGYYLYSSMTALPDEEPVEMPRMIALRPVVTTYFAKHATELEGLIDFAVLADKVYTLTYNDGTIYANNKLLSKFDTEDFSLKKIEDRYSGGVARSSIATDENAIYTVSYPSGVDSADLDGIRKYDADGTLEYHTPFTDKEMARMKNFDLFVSGNELLLIQHSLYKAAAIPVYVFKKVDGTYKASFELPVDNDGVHTSIPLGIDSEFIYIGVIEKDTAFHLLVFDMMGNSVSECSLEFDKDAFTDRFIIDGKLMVQYPKKVEFYDTTCNLADTIDFTEQSAEEFSLYSSVIKKGFPVRKRILRDGRIYFATSEGVSSFAYD